MRKYHRLSANKNTEKPRYVVYFDSESRVRADGRHVPYLVCATFVNYRDGREKSREYVSREQYEFWYDVVNFGEKKKRTVYVFAHNAGYDVIATGAIPIITQYGFRVTSWFEKGSTYIMYFRNKETGKKIIILSSTNFFAQTLEKLGDTLGVPKLSIEYNRADINSAIAYCRRDVEILKKAMETFLDFIEVENLGNFGRTVPGQAFNAYRHRFMEHEIFIHSNEEAIEIERGAYYGGRTECFYLGTLPADRKYLYYDVNSMYPAVMKENLYPVKLLTVRKRMSIESLYRHIQEGKGVCVQCTIRAREPVYPVRIKGNLIFPTGEFWTYLSTPEVKYAIEHNELLRVQKVCLYEMAPIFGKYVDYFYTMRRKCKEEGNRVYDLLYKLFLNSLYGKFGQKSESWERVGDAPPDEVKVIERVDRATGETETFKIFGGSIFKRIEEEESFNSFPAIAAHVTAYARMLLCSYFQKIGWDNVYYCDTDSLFTNDLGHDRLVDCIHETRLGALKLEKTSTEVKILCPKDYSFGSETRMKGVRRGSKQLDENTWETTVWPKLNSYLNTGQLSQYRNIKRIKKLRRVYSKGWVLTTGKVKPFVLENRAGENYILPFGRTGYQGSTITPAAELRKKYGAQYVEA